MLRQVFGKAEDIKTVGSVLVWTEIVIALLFVGFIVVLSESLEVCYEHSK